MLNSIGVWKLAAGFQQARIILTAAELQIFEALGSSSRSAKWLSNVRECDERALRYLLDALASLGILKKRGQSPCRKGTVPFSYSIEKSLCKALSANSKESILPVLRHSLNMWQRWDNLTSVVRTGKPFSELGSRKFSKEELFSFIGAMHAIGNQRADSVVKDCKIEKSVNLLDIGGGSGVYTIAFLKRYPKLKAVIFDTLDVISISKDQIAKAGLKDRVDYVAGDFEFDDLPRSFDVALLSAIIHQNSREDNRLLFEKIWDSLCPGGTLFIRDHVMNKDRTEPRLGAIFAINMLVATMAGGTYTFDEIKEDLYSAGFSGVKLARKGEYMDCVVSARRK